MSVGALQYVLRFLPVLRPSSGWLGTSVVMLSPVSVLSSGVAIKYVMALAPVFLPVLVFWFLCSWWEGRTTLSFFFVHFCFGWGSLGCSVGERGVGD